MPPMSLNAEITFLDLDATHPSLDHHRPGGLPLFGTVSGINAMINAVAWQLPASFALDSVEDVRIDLPCILADHARHRLEIETDWFTRSPTLALADCRVVTPISAEAATFHFGGRVQFSGANRPTLGRRAPPNLPDMDAVSLEQIYRAYFHGPTFQVLGAAIYQGNTVLSRLSLPTLDSAISVPARVLEFGLQTSGLLELASSGTMKVPHQISRIDYADLTGVTAKPLYALAAGRVDAGEISGFDIDVFTSTGDVVLRVKNYQTVALPFDSDMPAVTALRRQLIASRMPALQTSQ